jgi:hypothetical protein
VELIEGKYYSVLHTDSIVPENKKQYILKPAHTNWMAWRNMDMDSRKILLVGDKKILLLDSPIKTGGHFPVDYVIIAAPLKDFSPQQIMNQFSPGMIIVGNNSSRRQINKWYTNCLEKNISLHTLSYNGAFVLQ